MFLRGRKEKLLVSQAGIYHHEHHKLFSKQLQGLSMFKGRRQRSQLSKGECQKSITLLNVPQRLPDLLNVYPINVSGKR